MIDPTILSDFADDLERDRSVRDDTWADQTFPDRGPTPSNEVVVDPNAGDSPNVERPCEGEVSDD